MTPTPRCLPLLILGTAPVPDPVPLSSPLRGPGEGTALGLSRALPCRTPEVSSSRLAQRKPSSCTPFETAEQLGTFCPSSLQTLGLAMHLMGRGWSILAKPSGLPLRGENPKQGLSPKAGPSDGVGGAPQDQEEGRGDCWLVRGLSDSLARMSLRGSRGRPL